MLYGVVPLLRGQGSNRHLLLLVHQEVPFLLRLQEMLGIGTGSGFEGALSSAEASLQLVPC